MVAQIQLGEPAAPANHGPVARELAAHHAVNMAVRPTLGTRAAAGLAKAGNVAKASVVKKGEE